MGREIRRVPANWEHPRRECPHSPWDGGCCEAKENGWMCYQPMFDRDFDSALSEWLAEYEQWKSGEHEWQVRHPEDADAPFWEVIGDPPVPAYYRPKWNSAEWYQVYQTVSEGTPVTPPFATKAELIDYLVEYGDSWDQREGRGGWSREHAESFVEHEWAPLMVAMVSATGVEIKEPRDGSF